MRGITLLLTSATLSLACASQQTAPTRARPPQRFVVVSSGAVLHARPDDASPSLTVPTTATFRRVRARGDWVELETVADPSRQCAAALAPPDGLRVRFFVRAASLAQVLARPLRLNGPEGSLVVQPGVEVREGSRRTAPAELVHAGIHLTLVLVPAIGREHPAPVAERSITRAERLAPGTRATLPDGVVLDVSRDTNVYVRSRRSTIEGTRVTLATPCIAAEAEVPERAVLPVMELDIDEAETPSAARWVLRRDARLRWPDGSPAGRAATRVRITDAGRETSGTRCFHVPMRVVGAAATTAPLDIEVCADAGDVTAVSQ